MTSSKMNRFPTHKSWWNNATCVLCSMDSIICWCFLVWWFWGWSIWDLEDWVVESRTGLWNFLSGDVSVVSCCIESYPNQSWISRFPSLYYCVSTKITDDPIIPINNSEVWPRYLEVQHRYNQLQQRYDQVHKTHSSQTRFSFHILCYLSGSFQFDFVFVFVFVCILIFFFLFIFILLFIYFYLFLFCFYFSFMFIALISKPVW